MPGGVTGKAREGIPMSILAAPRKYIENVTNFWVFYKALI
jgi:hypothetical protein